MVWITASTPVKTGKDVRRWPVTKAYSNTWFCCPFIQQFLLVGQPEDRDDDREPGAGQDIYLQAKPTALDTRYLRNPASSHSLFPLDITHLINVICTQCRPNLTTICWSRLSGLGLCWQRPWKGPIGKKCRLFSILHNLGQQSGPSNSEKTIPCKVFLQVLPLPYWIAMWDIRYLSREVACPVNKLWTVEQALLVASLPKWLSAARLYTWRLQWYFDTTSKLQGNTQYLELLLHACHFGTPMQRRNFLVTTSWWWVASQTRMCSEWYSSMTYRDSRYSICSLDFQLVVGIQNRPASS